MDGLRVLNTTQKRIKTNVYLSLIHFSSANISIRNVFSARKLIEGRVRTSHHQTDYTASKVQA